MYMFNLYSQNYHRTVALVAQGVLVVQLVPWDLEALPAQFALVYLSFLCRPEHPEVRKRERDDVYLFNYSTGTVRH